MENLEIYNKLKEVPKEAQQKITGGRLSGMTDIKPMWRIEKLTEVFGPVGIGWYTKTIKKELIAGANNEMIATVDIELYVNYKIPYGLDKDMWSVGIEGSGGSSYISNEKKGQYTNDECFKMAYTDALSVACKSLGMGANVYWGDSKYNINEPTEEEAKAFIFESGKYKGKSIEQIAEEDEDYLIWWLDQGKNDKIKQMITLVTGLVPTLIPSEEEQKEKLTLMNKLNNLVNKTKIDYNSINKRYNVESTADMTIEQLKEVVDILEEKL